MRIVFAAGGTGGHILPALSVADELRARVSGLEALFVGTRYGLESRLVPAAGYEIRYISARGVRGRGAAARIRSAASIAVGFFQSLALLLRFKPDVVFGSGGYASAAVVLAASCLRGKIVIQEQNSIPGLTNRLLARHARRIYLGFEKASGYFGSHRGLLVTGNPLRAEIVSPGPVDLRKEFGIEGSGPVLLVFGGSQGARTLNRAAAEYLLARPGVRAIIQTGEQDYAWMNERLGGLSGRVCVRPYFEAMHRAYAAATVCLARAGALTVSELAAAAVPSILVPYPHAADDHQSYNASFLAEAGGAIVIRDSDLNKDTLASILDPLFADAARLAAMRSALDRAARIDAAAIIAGDVLAVVSAGRSEKA
ncbi:MAG: undecaprenyldiphospho-muramoylpentapeptide beta-N-acetylglucosaminyltransferase [Candidatus Krumholzibacteria bacterium]|nr:undecaprenyldiphospho-muramoylpentapeptide beta-N-acetylglucosaminyltransferase [Candidatus Krumholzibacteria bacterium]